MADNLTSLLEEKDTKLNEQSSSLFKQILNTQNPKNLIYDIYDIALGANKTHRIGEIHGQVVELRLLNAYEKNIICPDIAIDIVNERFSYASADRKVGLAELAYTMSILIIASTSSPLPAMTRNQPIREQFASLHTMAKIKLTELESLPIVSFTHLFNLYQELERKCNPELEKLSKEDIEGMLTQIKKQETPIWGLPWNVLVQLLEATIQIT